MKILHIISGDLWAGAEVQAFTLLADLHRRSGVQVIAAVMNDGELVARLRQENIPVTLIPETQFNAFQLFIRLRRLILNTQPDIIHTHRIKENILGSIANRLSQNAPSVRTIHGIGEHSAKGILKLQKSLLRGLDLWCGTHLQQKIIAVSNDLAEKLTRDFALKKIAVIENGVDINAIRQQLRPVDFRLREPQVTHIGIVGRLTPVKRIDIFLEMAAILRQSYPERAWHFHIFGSGPLHNQLNSRAKSLNLTAITTFHGYRGDIVACIAALDTLVMCSDHEGLPMTILEAIVIGTNIVAHAVGGLTELLAKIDSAALVRTHVPLAYADAVNMTLTRAERPETKLSFPSELISSVTNATRMLDLYTTLCSKALAKAGLNE